MKIAVKIPDEKAIKAMTGAELSHIEYIDLAKHLYEYIVKVVLWDEIHFYLENRGNVVLEVMEREG